MQRKLKEKKKEPINGI